MKGKKSGWRKKMPEQFQTLLDQASEMRLYLINENGPTSFVYCDDDKRKYKITIGETINCSCGQNDRGHCVHTIHAMLKKFRVDPTNAIIWQDGYGDSEVTDIIAGKYSVKKQPPQIQRAVETASSIQTQQTQLSRTNRQELDEDSLCPICQESMSINDPITYCKKTCGNNFHIQCLKVWVEQKQFQNVTCPMCRQSLGSSIWSDLLKEQQEFVQKNETHKYQCKGCLAKPIVGSIYQCVHCKTQVMCQKCHQKGYHKEHTDYFYKCKSHDQWMPSTKGQISVKQFLEQCFPFDDQVRNTNFMIIGNNQQKKCDICNQYNNKLRRLKCGHLVDQFCFEELEQGHYICPIDGVIQLEGYLKITGAKTQKGKPPLAQREIQNQTAPIDLRGTKVSSSRLRSINHKEQLEPPKLDLFISGQGRFNERKQVTSFKIRKSSQKMAAQKFQPDLDGDMLLVRQIRHEV